MDLFKKVASFVSSWASLVFNTVIVGQMEGFCWK